MEPESVALLGGLFFLLIAVVGGGFTIREIIMPGVPGWGRLASLVVGAALIVPYFASALDGKSSGPATSSTPIPSPGPREEAIYADSKRHVSRDRIEVSGVLASGEHADASVGDRIRIQFSLRNAGSEAVTFEATFIGARNPRGDNMDFAEENQGEELAPGDTLNSSSSIIVDTTGSWRFFPCYILSTGGEGTYCPDDWRAFPVSVHE